jgi:hypothetical protein
MMMMMMMLMLMQREMLEVWNGRCLNVIASETTEVGHDGVAEDAISVANRRLIDCN